MQQKRSKELYKGNSIKPSAHFFSRNLVGWKKWHDIQRDEKKKNPTTKYILAPRVIIQNGKRDKNFPKQKLKEFIITKLALQEMLKGFL